MKNFNWMKKPFLKKKTRFFQINSVILFVRTKSGPNQDQIGTRSCKTRSYWSEIPRTGPVGPGPSDLVFRSGPIDQHIPTSSGT